MAKFGDLHTHFKIYYKTVIIIVWYYSKAKHVPGRPGVLRFMGSQSRTRLSD